MIAGKLPSCACNDPGAIAILGMDLMPLANSPWHLDYMVLIWEINLMWSAFIYNPSACTMKKKSISTSGVAVVRCSSTELEVPKTACYQMDIRLGGCINNSVLVRGEDREAKQDPSPGYVAAISGLWSLGQSRFALDVAPTIAKGIASMS